MATNGPTVRPTWYLWQDGAFWILTGSWSKLVERVHADPAVAITIDVCDVETGETKQLIAGGAAAVLPFDVPRGRRLLSRYLGSDEPRWDARFREYLHRDPADLGTVWVRVAPSFLRASDLSYDVSRDGDST